PAAARNKHAGLLIWVYDGAVAQMADNRHIPRTDVVAGLQASPQFAEEAKSRKMLDRIVYDDESRAAALKRAGSGAKSVKFTDYVKNIAPKLATANIAIVEAAGEIRDG